MLAVAMLLSAFARVWPAAPDGPPVPLSLTAAERTWLDQHPRIRVGIMDAWPPMNYVDARGGPQGIGTDYVAALNKRLNGAIALVPAPFKDNYQQVLDGKLDALMDITQRPDREALFDFTKPYIVIPHVIVGRKDGDYFKSEGDLAGKTVALERGFYNVTHFRNSFPMVGIKEYESTSDALDAVSRGEADAYAGNRAVVVHLVEKELLNNLRLMGKLAGPNSTLQFGVRKGQLLLASILDKALASITAEEEQAIREKWVGGSADLGLTEAERQWLKAHPTLRVAIDSDRAPIEFRDEHGVPQGISSDYLNLLSEALGVRFEIVGGQSWPALLDKGRQREVDLFPSLMRTREREGYLTFSEVYFSLSIGIFIQQDAPYAGSVADLKGKKVAVVQGHSPEYLLRTNQPEVTLVPAASPIKALQLLEKGEVDAFVDYTMSTSYYLGQLGITDIKLTSELPERYEQSMGVRSDWPELVPILDKALRAIPKAEQRAIYTRWTMLGHGQKTDYVLIWKIVAAALAAVTLFGVWNWRLGKEIQVRKEAEAVLETHQERLEQLLEERTIHASELREAKDQLGAIFQAANVGIVFLRERVIQRCNPRLEELFGYEADALVGQSTRIWYLSEAEDALGGEPVYEQIRNGATHQREQQLKKKDGSTFWARITARALDPQAPQDPAQGIVGVIEDITAQREATEALKKALEEAEAADRIKSAFLATMSHELRTPLNSIIGFTGILIQGLVGPLNEEQKKQLGMVRDSSTHLLALINDVLDISKIEAGQLEVVAEPFDLRASLEKTVRGLHPLAERQGIALELQIAPEVGTLTSDRRRVEQILMNLGSNAIKFTERGSVQVSCMANDTEVEVRVRDTGIGIRAQDLDVLFHPFRQVDSGTTRKYEGTGLGLSICKRLVELLGGRIWVESSLGEGSTFTFALPVDRRKP